MKLKVCLVEGNGTMTFKDDVEADDLLERALSLRLSRRLEELRAELGRMHRETLEIRLATEELWVQVSGVAPPAVLTRSLGQIRARLADHYRLAGSELDEQKEELQTIRCELAEQHVSWPCGSR